MHVSGGLFKLDARSKRLPSKRLSAKLLASVCTRRLLIAIKDESLGSSRSSADSRL
jgi:hypothetical protein